MSNEDKRVDEIVEEIMKSIYDDLDNMEMCIRDSYMVDSSGDYKSNCRSGKNHPYSGSYGGDHQQTDPCFQTVIAGAGT